jgi:hypothetical protein
MLTLLLASGMKDALWDSCHIIRHRRTWKTTRSDPITRLMTSLLKYYDARQTDRWRVTDKSAILFHLRHSNGVPLHRYCHLSHFYLFLSQRERQAYVTMFAYFFSWYDFHETWYENRATSDVSVFITFAPEVKFVTCIREVLGSNFGTRLSWLRFSLVVPVLSS